MLTDLQIYKDAFENVAHFDDYIDATSGHLMWAAARLLGAADERVVRDHAYGVGVANLFQAIPALEALGRKPLIDGTAEGVSSLAQLARLRMEKAAKGRKLVSKAAQPALVAGYHARPILRAVEADPARVAADALDTNPAKDSLRFLNVSLRGWWR